MRRCLLFFVVLTVGFAPAPFPRPERRGSAGNDMVGTWKGNYQLRITADRMTYSPGPGAYEYVLRVNPSARPATYDIRGAEGNGAAGREFRGIYRVVGDTLTICYNSGTGPRPTAFEGPGKGTFTEVYARVRR
jgi:uncharacterized protein (TIGR03067 family)